MLRTNYNGIDCTKFLMAIAVIVIHINSKSFAGFDAPYPMLLAWFIRLAVPFFFVTSAYFLGRKMDSSGSAAERKEALRARYLRIFRLFGCWLLIYLPISVYCYGQNGKPWFHDVASYFGLLALTGESWYSWPLWFLWSMGVVLVIYRQASACRHARGILLGAFCLTYLLGWGIATYCEEPGFVLKALKLVCSRPLGGGIYMMAGLWLWDRLKSRGPMPWLGSVSIVLVSIVLYAFELPFSDLFGGIGLFLLAQRMSLPDAPIYRTLRHQSMWIYYTHMLVLVSIYKVLPHWFGVEWPLSQVGLACMGCFLAWLLACGLNAVSEVPRMQWMKRLVA